MERNAWHKHWPKGNAWSVNYPDVTTDIFLRTPATLYPERAALIFMEKEFTYADLWDGARRFAASLAEMGIVKGDMVCVHMTNCPQFAMAYHGIMLTGATYSPANPLYTPHELLHQLQDCGAKAIVTLENFVPILMEIGDKTKIKHIIVTNLAEALTRKPIDPGSLPKGAMSFQKLLDAHSPDSAPRVAMDAKKDLAHLAYTGGTTGVSKGVMHTHSNVVANTIQYHVFLSSGEPVVKDGILLFENQYEAPAGKHWEYMSDNGQSTIAITPWYHGMGTMTGLLVYALRGYTQILMDRFEPIAYLDLAEKYKVTHVSGSPALFSALLYTPGVEKRDFSSVMRTSGGSAPVPVALAERICKIFPNALFYEGMGMTELVCTAFLNPLNWSGRSKIGSIGLPITDTEAKIVDLETGDRELPVGQDGELCIRGPQVMLGYWNQPEETSAVLRDGWMYSGDIGHMDEDGFFFIVDRKKDMIIVKGYNVYPRDLEEILAKHPAVAVCSVIGVPDDAAMGELTKAFVVKKSNQDITEKELMDYVNKQVVHYKRIKELSFIQDSEMPRSPVGKILKRILRDQEIERRKKV